MNSEEFMNSKVSLEKGLHALNSRDVPVPVSSHFLKFFDTFGHEFYAKLYIAYKVTIFAIRLPCKHCNFWHVLPACQDGFQN